MRRTFDGDSERENSRMAQVLCFFWFRWMALHTSTLQKERAPRRDTCPPPFVHDILDATMSPRLHRLDGYHILRKGLKIQMSRITKLPSSSTMLCFARRRKVSDQQGQKETLGFLFSFSDKNKKRKLAEHFFSWNKMLKQITLL